MLIDISKIRVFRTNFDVVIGEFINPITNELQNVTLGVYKLGEKQEFFSANLVEIIDHSNRSSYEPFNCSYKEREYEEYDSDDYSGY